MALTEGDRVRLINMPNDPDPLPQGATGTVRHIFRNGYGGDQVDVAWDPPNASRTLMLLVDVDVYEVIEP